MTKAATAEAAATNDGGGENEPRYHHQSREKIRFGKITGSGRPSHTLRAHLVLLLEYPSIQVTKESVGLVGCPVAQQFVRQV